MKQAAQKPTHLALRVDQHWVACGAGAQDAVLRSGGREGSRGGLRGAATQPGLWPARCSWVCSHTSLPDPTWMLRSSEGRPSTAQLPISVSSARKAATCGAEP